MAKCILCGKELKSLEEAEKNVLAGIIEKSKCADFYKLYPHCFDYCKHCYISIDKCDKEKNQLLSDKLGDLKKTIDNPLMEEIDVFKWARIAELNGLSHEIVGDHFGAVLGYKASSDLLDLMINSYISRNQKVVDENGEKVSVLLTGQFEICKKALGYSKFLKRLTLGHLLKSMDANNIVLFLIYFDTAIELELKDEIKKITSVLQSQSFSDICVQDAVKCLLNKL